MPECRGLKFTGIPAPEELVNSPGYPNQERLLQGIVAVIECLEEIPCNPCETACPFGAIQVGVPITNLPRFLAERCTGCGRCIPACPGLAIFLVDLNYSPDGALVGLPYEFLPLPRPRDKVRLRNREGKEIGEGTVVRVTNPPRYNFTAVIYVTVPRELAMVVRSIWPIKKTIKSVKGK